MDFDVLIIGAGPAGASAALSCLHTGLRVCVVTKPIQNPPAAHTPLQSIHPGVLPLLDQLGLAGIVPFSSKATFTQIKVNGEFNPLSPTDEVWQGHHIDRQLFNAYLLNTLKSSEITVIEEDQVNILPEVSAHGRRVLLPDGKEVSTRFLIDASGHKRKTRHVLDLEAYFLTAPLYCWTGVAERDLSQQDGIPETAFMPREDGWVWVAPETPQRFTWTQVVVHKKSSFSLPFPHFKQVGKVEAYNVRWRVFRPICKDKILLCGDAAGMLDPAAGQGILNALMSGIMAARSVTASIAQPQLEAYAFMEYDQWFIEQFEGKVAALKQYYTELQINI